MEHYKYLIVGGGMTADSAVRGIRELDGAGSIGLISAETVGAFDNPVWPTLIFKFGPPLRLQC